MIYQIIKQPGGLFAIFSPYTKTIVVYDATDAEVMDWFVELKTRRIREQVAVILGLVALGEPEKAYYQFTLSWDEALARDREHGGEVHAVFSVDSDVTG